MGGKPGLHWFSAHNCVAWEEDCAEVFVGGTLVGQFKRGECWTRNVILIGLAQDPQTHLGRLAGAFDITSETLRQIRRQYETEGLEAVMARSRGGSKSKVTSKLRRKLEGLFEQGDTIEAAHAKVSKRHTISRSTVGKVRAEWAAGRATQETPANDPAAGMQLELPAPPSLTTREDDAPKAVETTDEASASQTPGEIDGTAADGSATDEPASAGAVSVQAEGATTAPSLPVSLPAEEEDKGADVEIAATAPSSGRWVQHVGTWLMVALVAAFGLHARADEVRDRGVERSTLRIAVDAVIMALAIGQRCVEGVRRLATPKAPSLLRAKQAPSASWVRRVLGRFADKTASARLHLAMAGAYIASARDAAGGAPIVFYVDNHLRPYTGNRKLRRGWRMQDKRAVPGSSDYYIHDEDGRPVLRFDVPSHASLTSMLPQVAQLLRLALGRDVKILLAFDRAGAFPEQMAELREDGFEFVTYERRPYRRLNSTAFSETIDLGGEKIGVCDSRTNLGSGRGRVRRIALRLPDGRQVNLLAISEQSPAWLASVMRGRWNQENGFKHGVERWGINQLDGRTTNSYPPGTVIPNPARRRIDRTLKIARTREGDARRKLAALAVGHPRRAALERDLEDAIRQQRELEAQRPHVPTHAPIEDTDLAGKLVHHTSEYKLLIDTIRIACANAESDLAGELGPLLRRPAEAKRVLQNLLLAPGNVRVGTATISVSLNPAGTRNELQAMEGLLAKVNGWDLSLPDDPMARPLRFRLQKR